MFTALPPLIIIQETRVICSNAADPNTHAHAISFSLPHPCRVFPPGGVVLIDVSIDTATDEEIQLREVTVDKLEDVKGAYREVMVPEPLSEAAIKAAASKAAAVTKTSKSKRKVGADKNVYALERLISRQNINGVDRYVIDLHD